MIACVQELATALASTNLSFAHFGWDSAPSGSWGVYAEDGAETFWADRNSNEQKITGSVDYYCNSDSEAPKTAIETALKSTSLVWWLNSIQYENETGFVHYEWRWHE